MRGIEREYMLALGIAFLACLLYSLGKLGVGQLFKRRPKVQATRYTERELAMLAYWEQRGYKFRPDERPPLNTHTPPRPSGMAPLSDLVLGSLLIAVTLLLLIFWMYTAAHWAGRPA